MVNRAISVSLTRSSATSVTSYGILPPRGADPTRQEEKLTGRRAVAKLHRLTRAWPGEVGRSRRLPTAAGRSWPSGGGLHHVVPAVATRRIVRRSEIPDAFSDSAGPIRVSWLERLFRPERRDSP